MDARSKAGVTLPGFDGSEPAEVVEMYLDQIRLRSPVERLEQCLMLSGETLELAHRGSREANEDLDIGGLAIEFARLTWGDAIASLCADVLQR
jgi:hypothetical protein